MSLVVYKYISYKTQYCLFIVPRIKSYNIFTSSNICNTSVTSLNHKDCLIYSQEYYFASKSFPRFFNFIINFFYCHIGYCITNISITTSVLVLSSSKFIMVLFTKNSLWLFSQTLDVKPLLVWISSHSQSHKKLFVICILLIYFFKTYVQ